MRTIPTITYTSQIYKPPGPCNVVGTRLVAHYGTRTEFRPHYYGPIAPSSCSEKTNHIMCWFCSSLCLLGMVLLPMGIRGLLYDDANGMKVAGLTGGIISIAVGSTLCACMIIFSLRQDETERNSFAHQRSQSFP
jgi:hypothetical protein